MHLRILLYLLITLGSFSLQAEDKEEPISILGKTIPKKLYHASAHSIRDLYVEDVPGSKSYWLGPWVEVIQVEGIPRFFIITGYNRFYVNVAWKTSLDYELSSQSPQIYGPFEGKPSEYFKFTPDKPTLKKEKPTELNPTKKQNKSQ